MNVYQVILSNNDILKISANRVSSSSSRLFFYDADNALVAEFQAWAGWNALGPVAEDAVKTNVCGDPFAADGDYVNIPINKLNTRGPQ